MRRGRREEGGGRREEGGGRRQEGGGRREEGGGGRTSSPTKSKRPPDQHCSLHGLWLL